MQKNCGRIITVNLTHIKIWVIYPKGGGNNEQI